MQQSTLCLLRFAMLKECRWIHVLEISYFFCFSCSCSFCFINGVKSCAHNKEKFAPTPVIYATMMPFFPSFLGPFLGFLDLVRCHIRHYVCYVKHYFRTLSKPIAQSCGYRALIRQLPSRRIRSAHNPPVPSRRIWQQRPVN
jgi:hypothetical protein